MKVVVHRTGSIGDFFAAIPALWVLRCNLPHAKLTVLISSPNSKYLNAKEIKHIFSWLDEVYEYDVKKNGLWFTWLEMFRWTDYDFLRSHWISFSQIDASFKMELKARLLALSLGFVRQNGFIDIKTIFDKRIKFQDGRAQSESSRLIDVATSFIERHGVGRSSCQLGPVPMKSSESDLLHLLSHKFLRQKVLSIVPGAGRDANRWPESRFAEIASKWIESKSDRVCVIIGSPKDNEFGDFIVKKVCSDRLVNLCGKTSISETIFVFKSSEIVLSNDTGPMHIAALTGTKIIGVFSDRDYEGLWDPFGSNHSIIRVKQKCGLCKVDDVCPYQKQCLVEISVDSVATQLGI